MLKPDDHIQKMNYSTVCAAIADVSEQIFAIYRMPRKNEFDFEKCQVLNEYRDRLISRKHDLLQEIEDDLLDAKIKGQQSDAQECEPEQKGRDCEIIDSINRRDP